MTGAGSMSDSMSGGVTTDSDATTLSTTASSTVDPDSGSSDPSDTATTDPTDPTDPTSSSGGSMTGPGDSSSEGGGSFDTCFDCVVAAQSGACATEWDACTDAADMGDFVCAMLFMSSLECLGIMGGDGAGCQCVIADDALSTAFAACLSDACGAACTCW